MYVGFHVNCLLVLSDFSQSWTVTTNVGNSPKYEISLMSLGVEMLSADRHDETDSRLAQLFAKAPNNVDHNYENVGGGGDDDDDDCCLAVYV